MAIDSTRIRHTFSTMMYIDYYTYELMQLTNKVIDESIYTCQPLTRSFLINKLMKKQSKDIKDEEKDTTIVTIISDYLN